MKIILDKKGLSLVEMLIVLAIIAILLSIAALPFSSWMSRYSVESEIKNMYADLMTARLRAMETNRMHFVQFNGTGTSYTVIADTDPAPFGDGSPGTGGDTPIMTKKLDSPIIRTLGLSATVRFDSRGFAIDLPLTGATATGAICVNTPVSADYDCIAISQTRINMGKLTGGCDAANCKLK